MTKPLYYILCPEDRILIDTCLKDLADYYGTCGTTGDWSNYGKLVSFIKGESAMDYTNN